MSGGLIYCSNPCPTLKNFRLPDRNQNIGNGYSKRFYNSCQEAITVSGIDVSAHPGVARNAWSDAFKYNRRCCRVSYIYDLEITIADISIMSQF